MRVSLEGKDFGFTLHPRRSRRHRAFNVTDANFADDLALITDSVAETQDFLRSLELAANSVGLHLNEGKTKYMGINIRDDDNSTLVAGSGNPFKDIVEGEDHTPHTLTSFGGTRGLTTARR